MKRTIKTTYFERNKEKKSVLSVYPNHAVVMAFTNMLMNTHGADAVEVTDLITGQVYAQLHRTKNNKVGTEYEYDPLDHKSPIRRSLHSILSVIPHDQTSGNSIH